MQDETKFGMLCYQSGCWIQLRCADEAEARLSLSKSERERCIYTTLSYQWGPNPEPMKKLTRGSIEVMATSINVKSLPGIFQESLAATRRLGVRYLWIDALCIIQDDDKDLADECLVMG